MYIVSQVIVPVIIVTPVTTVDCRLSSTEFNFDKALTFFFSNLLVSVPLLVP